MNESKLQIDDNVLDELVTGSLQGERYRSVLRALEARPHLWRKCAIAFLQEQALTQDLKTLSKGDIDWTSELRRSSEVSSLQTLSPAKPVEASLRAQAILWQRIGAMAALLVVSFSIGWMGAGLRGGKTSVEADRGATQAGVLGNNIIQGLAGNQPKPTNTLTRSIPSSELLASEFMQIDLERVPPELLQLERAGRIRIETYDAIMPLELADGTSAIVPVQHFRVVPVMFSY